MHAVASALGDSGGKGRVLRFQSGKRLVPAVFIVAIKNKKAAYGSGADTYVVWCAVKPLANSRFVS